MFEECKMKKPTVVEIKVSAMDDEGIEKDFVFSSMDDLQKWWKSPYEYKQCWRCNKLMSISHCMDICPECENKKPMDRKPKK